MTPPDATPFEARLASLRAAAEPTRLRLLRVLGQAELTVTELTAVLGQSQPGISRHLRLLCEAGLVERHQEGAWVFYRRLRGDAVATLCDGLTGGPTEPDDAALDAVLTERAAAASAYFAARAEEWDELRTHYGGNAAVEAAVRSVLSGSAAERLVDLGTGTGRILIALDGAYDEAVGYDVSPEMLSVARARLQAAGLTRARVRRGDLFALQDAAVMGEADLVSLHHVLHFLVRPDEAVAAAARLLVPGGRLLIVDFAPHGIESLRERHAHRRLGFADEEIARYARGAGLCVLRDETVADDAAPLTTRVWLLGERERSRREERTHAAH